MVKLLLQLLLLQLQQQLQLYNYVLEKVWLWFALL